MDNYIKINMLKENSPGNLFILKIILRCDMNHKQLQVNLNCILLFFIFPINK